MHRGVGALGWNRNAARTLLQRRSLREVYLRDAEGAVQPLQRTLLTSQSHSAAPQPARRAAGILRLRLWVLQKLAAEGCCPPLRGDLPGRRSVLRPQRTSSPSLRRLWSPQPLQAPVPPGSERQGSRSRLLPARGAGLSLGEPVK